MRNYLQLVRRNEEVWPQIWLKVFATLTWISKDAFTWVVIFNVSANIQIINDGVVQT